MIATGIKRAACLAAAVIALAIASPPATAYAVNFAEHTVEGVSPAGTTINLFDYWIDSQGAPDNNKSSWATGNNLGINQGHRFKFVYGGAGAPAPNTYTGPKNGPLTGIVGPQLDDNMPKLSDTYGGESLSYLFDPTDSSAAGYRATYRGVKNLLQVDDNGYYYYNSMANFASFDSSNNAFTLYDAPAVASHSNANAVPTGQFFPFNTAEDVFDPDKTDKEGHLVNKGASLDGRDKGIISTDKVLNHWFGLAMSTRFVQPKNGIVDDEGTPMTYEFSGDDDVWIFIDGVLVGDLGGIHDPNRITIDFSTGRVTTYKNLTNDNKGGVEIKSETTTIKQTFEKAGASGRFKGETFEDGTYHTLKFFYLERGNYAANMNLRFNLVTVPESQIVKVDQVGNPLGGVSFELYGQQWNEKNKAWEDGQKTLVAEGTTDDNGELVLTDPQTGDPIHFDDIYSRERNGGYTRYRLHEVKQLEGYRSAGDMYLEYHPPVDKGEFGGYVTSEQSNIWATGAYASAGVLVSAPTDFYKLAADGDTSEPGEPIDADKIAGGTLFAVVLQYKGTAADGLGDSKNWKVVSGDSLSGWKTFPAGSIGEVAQAAATHGAGHPFELSTSGTYEATIEDLPGELTTYYNLIKATENGDTSNTKFTVAYYFTEGKLEGANGDNTHRLYIEGDTPDTKWGRAFSVNLQVPNIKNFLYVQKTDADWKPITDGEGNEDLSATFNLYKEDAVEIVDGKPKLKDGAEPYDTARTTRELMVGTSKVMDSGASFPSERKALKEGVYYLAEDTAPEGYKKHEQLTKVVVTDKGVFADAGAKDDDVRVRTGVGHLVRTMARFASGEEIDATLRDITAQLMVSDEGPTYSQQGGWKVEWALADPEQKLDLSYGASSALLQYGLTGHKSEEERDTFEDVTIMADSGWSSLAIKQNYGTAGGTPSSANKQDLKDTHLNRLFSESTTVQIANHAEGALKISKVVENAAENDATQFTVEVSLWRKADGSETKVPVSGTYSLAITDADGKTVVGQPEKATFKGGKTTLTLQKGWTALIGGAGDRLCADKGYGYTVKEVNIPGNFIEKDGSPSNSEGTIARSIAGTAAESNVVTVTNIYVLGFGILKVDPSNGGASPLQGVAFELRDDLGEDGAADGVYDPQIDTQSQLFSDKEQKRPVSWAVQTDGKGELSVYGLKIGKSYWVVETRALGGYQPIKPVRFTVQKNGTLRFDYTDKPVEQEGGVARITIENRKVPTLPKTGGPGNVPLYAAGMVLVGGAAFAIVRQLDKRR